MRLAGKGQLTNTVFVGLIITKNTIKRLASNFILIFSTTSFILNLLLVKSNKYSASLN